MAAACLPGGDTDIRLFKTSMLARRWPGLASLPPEELKVLVAQDPATSTRIVTDPRVSRTYPKTQIKPASSPKSRDTSPSKQPWSPVAPVASRDSICRRPDECYLREGCPYDVTHKAFLQQKHEDEAKRLAPFLPSSASQAKDTIRVDYYLNSQLSGKIDELAATRSKAQANLQQLKARTQRGKMYVPCQTCPGAL